MHRTDAPGNLAGLYTEGDPSMGIPPTVVSAAAANSWQEELANFIESKGIVLNKLDNTQLTAALGAIGGGVQGERNVLINGAFQSWRQTNLSGTVLDSPGDWHADRWASQTGEAADSGSGSASRIVRVLDEPGLPDDGVGGEHSYFKHSQLVANASSGVLELPNLRQRVEDVRTLQDRTVAISFYAKLDGGDPVTAITPTLTQNFGAGGSADVATVGADLSVSGTAWTRYFTTITLPSVAGKSVIVPFTETFLEFKLDLPRGGTRNVSFWGMQLEAGGAPTAFQTRSDEVNRLLCARYYWTSLRRNVHLVVPPPSADSVSPLRATGSFDDVAAIKRLFTIDTRFPVPMRRIPDLTWKDTSTGGTGGGIDRITYWNPSALRFSQPIDSTAGTSELSTGYPVLATVPAGATHFEVQAIADAEFPL